MSKLVLSLFPGIGLLDMAFEQEGFCVVRGPDLLWGGDVANFHPSAGRFDGVIGGPPCQKHSMMKHLAKLGNGVEAGVHGDQIPEFRRVVEEAQPMWFVMENVPQAYDPAPAGYTVQSVKLNNRWLGEDQNRLRRFWFGARVPVGRFHPITAVFQSKNFEPAVLAGHGPAMGQRVRGIQGRSWQDGARLQGLPDSWIEAMEREAHFTVHGFKKVVGNGVPLPMGRAVAKAVMEAVYG